MLMDYLFSQGFPEIKTPRDTVKKAFEIGLIPNGRHWLEMLDDRNLTTHVYDEESAIEIEQLIRDKYIKLFHDLEFTMQQKFK